MERKNAFRDLTNPSVANLSRSSRQLGVTWRPWRKLCRCARSCASWMSTVAEKTLVSAQRRLLLWNGPKTHLISTDSQTSRRWVPYYRAVARLSACPSTAALQTSATAPALSLPLRPRCTSRFATKKTAASCFPASWFASTPKSWGRRWICIFPMTRSCHYRSQKGGWTSSKIVMAFLSGVVLASHWERMRLLLERPCRTLWKSWELSRLKTFGTQTSLVFSIDSHRAGRFRVRLWLATRRKTISWHFSRAATMTAARRCR